MSAPPLLMLTVPGTPAGQGNTRRGDHGKQYHANGQVLLPWRDRIRAAALQALDRHEFAVPELADARRAPCAICGVRRADHGELLGAVRLQAVITVARPKSTGARWPITRRTSDWDHYARAIGDALSGVVYADDSQVVDGRAVVTYPHVHPDALHEPGALIKIWPIEESSCS